MFADIGEEFFIRLERDMDLPPAGRAAKHLARQTLLDRKPLAARTAYEQQFPLKQQFGLGEKIIIIGLAAGLLNELFVGRDADGAASDPAPKAIISRKLRRFISYSSS